MEMSAGHCVLLLETFLGAFVGVSASKAFLICAECCRKMLYVYMAVGFNAL
jgi:hypothetical protein